MLEHGQQTETQSTSLLTRIARLVTGPREYTLVEPRVVRGRSMGRFFPVRTPIPQSTEGEHPLMLQLDQAVLLAIDVDERGFLRMIRATGVAFEVTAPVEKCDPPAYGYQPFTEAWTQDELIWRRPNLTVRSLVPGGREVQFTGNPEVQVANMPVNY